MWRARSVLLLAFVASAACQKGSLQPDPSGTGGIGTGTLDGGSGAAGGGFGGVGGAGGAGVGGGFGGAGIGAADGGAGSFNPSPCVITSVPLPWMTVDGRTARFEVVASGDAIAVLHRDLARLDVRTYRIDGTSLGGLQFAADAQFQPYGAGHFLLVTRGQTMDIVATDLPATLTGGRRVAAAPGSATELLRAAVQMPGAIIALTTAHFVNLTTGTTVAWTTALGPDAQALASGSVYGAAATAGEILVAGGGGTSLGLMVLDPAGRVLRSGIDPQGLGTVNPETTTAIPYGTGLLMIDGNPPRLTQIGFDLSRTELGHHLQMETFYRTTPRVAAVPLAGDVVGIWLTVFPTPDNSQGGTAHQVFGCALDVANPSSCTRMFSVAETGLTGYLVAPSPIAATGLDQRTIAVAHSDAHNRTWLRITDTLCSAP
jgi:hypothetical protein